MSTHLHKGLQLFTKMDTKMGIFVTLFVTCCNCPTKQSSYSFSTLMFFSAHLWVMLMHKCCMTAVCIVASQLLCSSAAVHKNGCRNVGNGLSLGRKHQCRVSTRKTTSFRSSRLPGLFQQIAEVWLKTEMVTLIGVLQESLANTSNKGIHPLHLTQ